MARPRACRGGVTLSMTGGSWPFAVRTVWKRWWIMSIVSRVGTRVISVFETAATFQTGGAFYALPLTSFRLITRSARATAALAVDADERRASPQTSAANAIQLAQCFGRSRIVHS